MAGDTAGAKLASRWRIGLWCAGAALLLLPLVAMQLTDEVAWDLVDFAFAGALVAGVGLAFEAAARRSADRAWRAGVGLALATAFLLVWLNAAVGIIGSEDNPANLLYGGVLAVALAGSVVARFKPRGMARAMVATAVAQVAVALGALAAGAGSPGSGPLEILALNAAFAALWLGSARLLRAARPHTTG